jgi:hypothetical protein
LITVNSSSSHTISNGNFISGIHIFCFEIVGKIKNNTEKTYSYAQVEINLYDKENTLIGSTLANINNFEGGATWKFEALVTKDETLTYKIKAVTKQLKHKIIKREFGAV